MPRTITRFCGCCAGSAPTVLPCAPGAPCTEVQVPTTGLTLSITATTNADCLPTGDYALTYQTGVLVDRQLDQSEQPCIVTVETYADGVFSDLIPVDLGICGYSYIRFSYDPCTGVLAVVIYVDNEDCTNDDKTTATISGTVATFTVEDCDPYFADVTLGGLNEITGSISV